MKGTKSTTKKSEDGGLTVSQSKRNLGLKRNKATANLLSFDAYFRVLQRKNINIRSHHKDPMAKFLAKLGNVKAQSAQWFEAHLKDYG